MLYSKPKPFGSDTITITFESGIFPGATDPFVPIVTEYAKEYGYEIRTVDKFYQYKFVNDELDLSFRWNGNFTIYVYVPVKRNYADVELRLNRIISRLNREVKENKTADYPPLSMI